MIYFRHADNRYPFLWEAENEVEGRWNGHGDGPVQYLTDTADGAWAEFLRREEIKTEEDLATVARAIWAVEVEEEPEAEPHLPREILLGGIDTHPSCREEAARLRWAGARNLLAPSAALREGEARGWRVEGGPVPGPDREGRVLVLFGTRSEAIGWQAAHTGRPSAGILSKVRHLSE